MISFSSKPSQCVAVLLCLVVAAINSTVVSADANGNIVITEGVDASTGFRMERYRSPVPACVPGATTVDAESVADFSNDDDVILIDVYPPRGLGPDPLSGQWIISENHSTIDGSIWLPEVGRGHLEPPYESYFKKNLLRLTNGNLSQKIVFFCTADCWQSWNAARRAVLWGYSAVHWYPEGIDGWLDSNRELVPATPINFHD